PLVGLVGIGIYVLMESSVRLCTCSIGKCCACGAPKKRCFASTTQPTRCAARSTFVLVKKRYRQPYPRWSIRMTIYSATTGRAVTFLRSMRRCENFLLKFTGVARGRMGGKPVLRIYPILLHVFIAAPSCPEP